MRIFADYPSGSSPVFDPAAARERIRVNLAGVRAIVAIASAKGGAGKSAIAVNLAAALALKGRKIALLDADLNAPSVPAMLGMKVRRRLLPEEIIEPAAGPFGLRVAWSGMVPGGEPAPISFVEENGAAPPPRPAAMPCHAGALADLLSRIAFGPLDAIVADLAPGIGRLREIAALVALDAVILVSRPSGLAANAAREAIEAAAAAGAPVAGIVENLAGFNCDGCRTVRPLWPEGNLPGVAHAAGVPILARLPFDSRLAESSDRGTLFVKEWADTPTARELENLANRIDAILQANAHPAAVPAQCADRTFSTSEAAK
ncbi:MAG: P-loop NTPase [Candidatus Binataceae bacterium]